MSCCFSWTFFQPPGAKQQLYGGDLTQTLVRESTAASYLSYEQQAFVDGQGMMWFDLMTYLTDDILVKVDRMSMANSLEVRVPFLDHEIVEFAFTLPTESKINGDIRKRILQDTFKDILPTELYNRPKKGFEVPLLKLFRNPSKLLFPIT